MTTTNTTAAAPTRRRRPTNGNEYVVGYFDFPVPPGGEDLLPEPIREARAKMLELELADNKAQGAIFTTSEAIKVAETKDAAALGAAIFAGERDPGPVHLTAARAAHAEANRQAAGIAQALIKARQTYFEVARNTDRTEAVAAVEALAAAELASAEDALLTAQRAYGEVRSLMSLAASLDTFPAVPMPLMVDADSFSRGVRAIREQLAVMAPGYDATHTRGGATATEARIGAPNAYTPRPAA